MFIIKYRKLYIKKLDSIKYEFALGEKHEATRFATEREASEFVRDQQLWNTQIERVKK